MNRFTTSFEGLERFVKTSDGARIRTVVQGEGLQTVVLAHGYGGAAEHWNLITAPLVEHGWRVVSFDQRGHGKSTIGSDGVGPQQMGADYAAILRAYDLEDVVLVGHSMGGFLSIQFLLDGVPSDRARVRALLLMATFAGDVNRDNPQNRLLIPLIRSGVLQFLLRFRAIQVAFTKSLAGHFEMDMVDPFIQAFLAQDHGTLVPILQALVDVNHYPRLGEIDLPCTVVVGDSDKTTPSFHAREMHVGIGGSRLVSLPGAGHALNWETPQAVVDEIVAFGA